MGARVLKLNKVHLFAKKWQKSMFLGLLLRKYFFFVPTSLFTMV